MLLIALLLVVVPILELYVIVQVAQSIGVVETIALLVAMSVVGAWLVKAQGLAVWRRFNETMLSGQVPHREIVDGALLLLAGALLLAPGFTSDAFGLVLLFPPTRALVRGVVLSRFRAGQAITTFGAVRFPGRGGRGRAGTDVVDVDSWEDAPDGQRATGELDR
ncbi:MAG: FxsA family protein [Acidimicrobiia bacterium]|nr:FxsA family protein [Acidimicrobiia bacterium]